MMEEVDPHSNFYYDFKIAIVIGNSKYDDLSHLPSVNDRDM